MLLKRLAKLASKLDNLGHTEEANGVDKILKQLVAFWGTQMPKYTCKCESCEYGIAHDGSGLWVAVCNNGVIRTSTDGTTWSTG